MVTSGITAALRDSYLFEDFSDDELVSLAGQCRLIKRQAGEILFHENDPADYFYILLSGQVQAFKTSPEGKEVILHLFREGDVFAEFPVFGGNKAYPVTTLCLKDSRLLAIHGEGFKTLALNRPEILLKILMRLAERLRYFTSMVEDLSLRTVDARLARYLLTNSRKSPDRTTTIEIHKKTLAAILGTVPETLSRTFKKLSAEGLVAVQGSRITILDRKGLEKLAEMQAITD